MNPTSEQLSARLNPTPVQIQIPSQGLFRTVGDYGTTIYGTDSSSGKLAIYNLIGSNSPLFKDTADRASFGNAGGQATEAIKRLKEQYGVDWNSLNQVNLGDFMQQLRKNGIGYTDPDGAFTGYSVQGDFNSLRQQPLATLSSQTINNTPNALATAQQIAQQMSNPLWNSGIDTSKNIQQAPSGTPNNLNSQTQIGTPNVNQPISKPVPITALQPGMTGESVKQLQDYLVANGYMTQDQVNTGYGIYGPQTTSAVKALQEKLGVDNSTGVGFFGPKTISALQGNSMQSTPYGTINPNVPISLNTSNQNIFPSSVLGSKLTTEDVLNKTQSYNDLINSYLKQQADAQSQLNNVKMQQLQGMSSIRQSDSVLPLQGQDLAEFEKQMAFKQLPAEIALQNAQTGLALFKQSPQYLNEQDARSTAFNLLQSYPDAGVQYNPNLSAQDNLSIIQNAVSSSPKFQAQNSSITTDPITGAVRVISKLPSGGYNVQSIGGGVTTNTTIPTQFQSSLENVQGYQYFDMGKLKESQIPALQRLSAQSGIPMLSKDESSKLQEAYASFSGADSLIQQIVNLSGNVLTADNSYISQTAQAGRLKSIELFPTLSTDNNAKQFVSARKSLLSLITRASGEKGVLTAEDVKRIADALPSYGDNAQLAAQKAANMTNVINSVLQGAIKAYVGAAQSGNSGVKQTSSGGVNDPLGIR